MNEISDVEPTEAPASPPEFIQPALGLHPGLSFETYKQAEGVNASFIKAFADCPAKAKFGVNKETPALEAGTLIHCAVLESAQLEARFVPTKLERRGTKAWEAAEIAAGGRTLVKSDDYEAALRIRDAAFSHPTARELLSDLNVSEQSFFWIDPNTGLLCKGRADALRSDIRVALDVKSTASADKEDFAKSIANFRYHWQQAHYENGIGIAGDWLPEAFVFICLEKEPPYLVACYEIMPIDVAMARESVKLEMEKIADCMEHDVWPGYGTSIEQIELPRWARRLEMGEQYV